MQTLPEDFKWGDVLEQGQSGLVRQMIGEAVPPRFTEAHGDVLADLLSEGRTEGLLLEADRRVSNAAEKLEAASAVL